MKTFTVIAVRTDDADRFRRLAKSLRIPHHRLFGGLVAYFSKLSHESQEAELGLASPASPSDGDVRQSDDSAFPKQARSIRPSARQRKAG